MMAKAKIDPRVRAKALWAAGVRPGTQEAKAFGGRLERAREARGEKRTETARKLGVTTGTLALWERGAGVPGEAAYARIRRWLGAEECRSLDGWLGWLTTPTDAGVSVAQVRASFEYETTLSDDDDVPVKAAADPGEDRLIAAVLASGLGSRQKALLCAAVIAMVAGVDVQVEVSARV